MPHRFLCLTLVAVLSLIVASTASAQFPSGLLPNGGGTLPSGPFSAHPPDTMAIVTAPESHPVSTPNTWNKVFLWDYAGGSVSPGDRMCLMETIPLIYPASTPPTGKLPLTDWHETITSTSFNTPMVWSLTGLAVTANGIPVSGLTPMLSGDGKDLTLLFDPLTIPMDMGTGQTPLVFGITKYFQYPGPGTITSGGQGDNAVITINVSEQATTPEPSSFVLAGIASCSLFAYARRRRKAAIARGL